MSAPPSTGSWRGDAAVSTVRPAEEILLGFARALRAAGVAVTADRERTYLGAVATVGLEDQPAVYAVGRATLCGSPADLERYDLVYAAWFGAERPVAARRAPHRPQEVMADLEAGQGSSESDGSEDEVVRAAASATEVLRHRDIASLSARERAQLARLFAALRPRPPRRRTHRLTPARRGVVDGRATLREMLRRQGEPGVIRRRHRAERPRRVVLLLDVSGSMSAYADALLRLAHVWCRGPGHVEVFTLGTRLTHLTAALAQPDPDRALVAAGRTIPDWSGGTRLAHGIKAFLDLWGRRGMARGAVVVLVSDGWERDNPEGLGEQMRRLHGLAHHVVWANPHRGHEAYEPVQQGIIAALPYVDSFVAGHSLAAFSELMEVVGDA
ncbi:vWA domain-containing protein [Knoellia subterranea]|uniref:von Willebrand factor A n=1 Tax=Knoellia subterranea KCTC 19937 TaxID=1385521 RepID=A0A0A0JLE1_9MICO|nr:VWA domain-containing protein [Knoellia subterranea]KGN38275.1 von Willebrand factor A [Knoellia subterranea KCTC 19937]